MQDLCKSSILLSIYLFGNFLNNLIAYLPVCQEKHCHKMYQSPLLFKKVVSFSYELCTLIQIFQQMWLDVNISVLCDGTKCRHFSVAKLKIIDSIAAEKKVMTKTSGLESHLKTTWSTIITETQVVVFSWDLLYACSNNDGTQLVT